MPRALGIDFGTAFCAAACLTRSGQPEAVPMSGTSDGRPVLPSVVAHPPAGAPVAGPDAVRIRLAEPDQTVSSIKRLISALSGEAVRDPWRAQEFKRGPGPEAPCLEMAGRELSAVAVAGILFAEIRARASAWLGEEVSRAAIGRWVSGEAPQECCERAMRAAGFNEIHWADEALLAALAYDPRGESKKILAVCDFGAAHVAVSVLAPPSRILSRAENREVGGATIDRALAAHLARDIREDTGVEIEGRDPLMRWLLTEAEKIKCTVSHRGSCDFHLRVPDRQLDYARAVSRFEVAQHAEATARQTESLAAEALRLAGLAPADIGDVIVTGGASRMPVLQNAVGSAFARKCPVPLHPDTAVALGAAVYGSKMFR